VKSEKAAPRKPAAKRVPRAAAVKKN
jgi:hypothetical protein